MLLRTLARLFFSFASLVMAGIAIFAYQLGIDHDQNWGSGRIILLILALCIGLVLWAPPLVYWLAQRSQKLLTQLQPKWVKRIVYQVKFSLAKINTLIYSRLAVSQIKGFSWLSWRKFFVPGILLILIGLGTFYWWIATSGRMTTWQNVSSFYDRLANSFIHHELALLDQPSPELLALKDPHDVQARLQSGASYIHDASFFEGKYYLYWGPVPALFFLVIKKITPLALNDAYLAFAFLLGTVIISMLLFDLSRKKIFPNSGKGWITLYYALICGLVNPFPFLLTRPGTYEVSIAGGQFFLLSSLLLVFLFLRNTGRPKWHLLVLSSITIIAGVGTRVSLGFALLFLSGVVTLYILLSDASRYNKVTQLLLFLVPQGAGTVFLLAYNYLRFGSIWEFGMRYAFSVVNMPQTAPHFLHVTNIIPNLYLYLFRAPELSLHFPFVTAPWIDQYSWPFFIKLPSHYYYSEPVIGMLIAVPFVFFSVFVCMNVQRFFKRGNTAPVIESPETKWWLLTLMGVTIIVFLTVLMFFASMMRYMADFMPLLVLLSFYGFLCAMDRYHDRKFTRGLLAVLFFLLSFVSILLGVLLGMSGANNHLLNNNPAVFYNLSRFFSKFANP